MKQENPYFSNAMIFYGVLQKDDEGENEYRDEMILIDFEEILNQKLSMNNIQTGLIFHWTESESEIHFS